MSHMLAARRQFFAEEIEACCNLHSRALVEALATVPREAFLGPGPWTVTGEGDLGAPPRLTRDADPGRLYHNVAVAIDPARRLFNGAPGIVSLALDALGLAAGSRVVHVGAGLGYYTAIIAHVAGPTGRVVAFEVDEALAADARRNLAPYPWVDLRQGDASGPLDGGFDALMLSAGVTHPLDSWLDALAGGGRLVLPLTAAMPQMGTIGKGMMLALTKASDTSFDVRPLSMVAIYSALGIRDDATNQALGQAFMRSPSARLRRLRRDPHERDSSCWLHGGTFCFTT